MSAYGQVSYSENDVASTEVLNETNEISSAMDDQVEKFDNSYTLEKSKNLYELYDKISINEEQLKAITQVKTNAVSKAVPFRATLVLTTAIVVTLMLAFLCVYNIFVINGISKDISYLQDEVITYEYDLSKAKALNEELTSIEGIQSELMSNGYNAVTCSNIVAVSLPEKTEVIELAAQTNWFDAVCNFLSQIFG